MTQSNTGTCGSILFTNAMRSLFTGYSACVCGLKETNRKKVKYFMQCANHLAKGNQQEITGKKGPVCQFVCLCVSVCVCLSLSLS